MTGKVVKKDAPKKRNKPQNQNNRKYPVDTLLPINNTYGRHRTTQKYTAKLIKHHAASSRAFLQGFADTFINVVRQPNRTTQNIRIMAGNFSTTILIDSEPSKVWASLTDPKLISDWMGQPEMKLEVETSWKTNSPIFIRGFHHIKFENKGIVLKYIDNEILSYSHLSSVSRLPDKIENYSILEFVLTPETKKTILTLNISNFPTETIQKHLQFYWRGTIHRVKEFVETQG